jgi:hypothetical protein
MLEFRLLTISCMCGLPDFNSGRQIVPGFYCEIASARPLLDGPHLESRYTDTPSKDRRDATFVAAQTVSVRVGTILHGVGFGKNCPLGGSNARPPANRTVF